MPYTNNAYAVVADVQSALFTSNAGVAPTLTAADATWVTNELIPDAQAYIDSYIGHSFQTDGTTGSPATRFFDGNDMETLFIDECQSINQVLEYSTITMLQNGVWVQVSSSNPVDITADCILGPYNRTTKLWLKRLSGIEFLTGIQNYKVLGVFGNGVVPADIHRACVRLVIHWYKMRTTNYANAVSTQGQVTQHYKHSIPDDVTEILDSHARYYVSAGR